MTLAKRKILREIFLRKIEKYENLAGILNLSSKIENWAEEILEVKMRITEDNPEMIHYWTYFPYDISVWIPRTDRERADWGWIYHPS